MAFVGRVWCVVRVRVAVCVACVRRAVALSVVRGQVCVLRGRVAGWWMGEWMCVEGEWAGGVCA